MVRSTENPVRRKWSPWRPVARSRWGPGKRRRGSDRPPGRLAPVSELLDRRVAQHQVLHAVLAAEIDLRLGVVAGALEGQDRAQAVGVMRDLVPGCQGGDGPVAGRAHPG